MNVRKLLAAALITAFLLTLVSASSAKAPERAGMTGQEREAKIAELLDYSSRLHGMKALYGPKLDNADLDDPYANGRLIVKSEKAPAFDGALAFVKGPNDRFVAQYASPDIAREAAAKLRKTAGVEYVSPDLILTAAQQPHDDSFYSWGYGPDFVDAFNFNEWLLEQVDESELPEIVVGLCDTGVDSDHEFLADRLVPGGWDFVDNDDDPEDESGHGTSVASVVVDGTLPNVKIMSVRVVGGSHNDTSDVVNGMEYASLCGCKVVNVSYCTYMNEEAYRLYYDVINTCTDNGTVFCIPAGNNESNSDYYLPAGIARAFTVAAHDKWGNMTHYTNTGPSVDITAPGGSVICADMGGGFSPGSGTSFSSPHAAAACAMVLSYYPDMDPDEVIDVIKASALPADFEGGGTGMLNVTDLLRFDAALNVGGSFPHFISRGDHPWQTDENGAFSGNSGAAGSTSALIARPDLRAYQRLSFEYKVSSERGGDFFRFSAGGNILLEVSGEQDWQTFECVLDARGVTELSWEFTKNASGNGGSDMVRIRSVRLEDTLGTVMNGGGSLLFSEEGEFPWIADSGAARSGNSGVNGSVSATRASVYCGEGYVFAFEYKTECGAGDAFGFYVNGIRKLTVPSSADWTRFEYTVPESGECTFEFRFEKDGGGAVGADCAWVRNCEVILSLDGALNVPGGSLSFVSESPYPWFVEGDHAVSGNRGVSSSRSVLRLSVGMLAGETLSFRYKVSTEENYDWFTVKANGSEFLRLSGGIDWTDCTFTAPSDGSYSFTFEYSKDGTMNGGEDRVYLDDVRLSPSWIPGDVNGDSNVNVTDALIVLRVAMGIYTDGYDGAAADLDGDGTVTVTDALIILRIAMGLM